MTDQFSKINWYHQVRLPSGELTPGVQDSASILAILDELGLPKDCTGKRVLDVGARDGYFSFAMEQRGAEVVAIDHVPPDRNGFDYCKRAFGSEVEHITCNVYDLERVQIGRFDVILFLGIFYHTRHLLLALDKIRALSDPGTLVFVETQLAREILDKMDIPLFEFYADDRLNHDPTNWFVPNMAGLRGAMIAAEFEPQVHTRFKRRGLLRAVAVDNPDIAHYRARDKCSNVVEGNLWW
jgi:tRNA (mo5U34)-methyltransferase